MLKIDCFASGSSGNLYRVDDGRTNILLECGIPYRQIQKYLDFKVGDIEACLVTHEHSDHCKAVNDMLMRGTNCYMSSGTAEALEIRYDPSTCLIPDKGTALIGTWQVTAFSTQHDAAEPLGFLLDNSADRILYATDTYYLKYRFPACTVMMIECNHSYEIVDRRVAAGVLNKTLAKRLTKSHMSLENLVEFLKANDLSRLREIYLIHLSDANSDEKLFQRTIAALTGVPVYIAPVKG